MNIYVLEWSDYDGHENVGFYSTQKKADEALAKVLKKIRTDAIFNLKRHQYHGITGAQLRLMRLENYSVTVYKLNEEA